MENGFGTLQYDGHDIAFDPKLEDESYARDHASRFSTDPMELVWRDLTLKVKLKKKRRAPKDAPTEKTILHGMSGYVRSGQMLAVMGASGAGKTSLLNLLAGRITTTKGATATGTVEVNGKPRDYNSFRQLAAYVMQDDDMFADLTVREQIRYAATLRLPSSMSTEAKEERVSRVVQNLGLSKVADSRIGGELVRGISGGERKRVSIGTELVTDPTLLFLDEPTTGLDSFNALNVMQSMRQLASAGHAVVSTIHQPRSAIFALFDQLLLLSEGRVMYFGPAKDAAAYFSSLSFKPPAHFNTADYLIDLLSVDPRSNEKEETTRARIKYVGDQYDSQALMPDVGERIDLENQDNSAGKSKSKKPRQFQASLFKEFSVLLGRSVKLAMRERMSNGVRLFQVLLFSVILGLLWLGNGRDASYGDRRSLLGVLFFILINQAFGGVFSVIFQFPKERSVITRERASNMYRTSTYFLSKTMTDAPKTLIFNAIFSVIVYWMVGLKADAGSFFKYLLVLFLVSTFAESLAVAISVLTGDPQASASLIPVFVILCVLFGGFFIATDQLPAWISWFRYISFVFWGFTALTITEFPLNSGEIDLKVRSDSALESIEYWYCIAALVGLVLFTKFLGYFFLAKLRGPKFLKF